MSEKVERDGDGGVKAPPLCDACDARRQEAANTGKIAFALCAACSSANHAAHEAYRRALPVAEAPWKWEYDGLYDANGIRIAEQAADGIGISHPVVSELIRLAPEMLAFIQRFEKDGNCNWCGGEGRHAKDCTVGRIIAAIDAARSST